MTPSDVIVAVFWVCVGLAVLDGGGQVGGAKPGPWRWQNMDAFDEIDKKLDSVTQHNCKHMSKSQLRLPDATLAQAPRFNKLLTSRIEPNRTDLLHLHNMALNRAFFWSFLFRKMETPKYFLSEPGLLYHYFSNSAILSANEYFINGSALFFDKDSAYANWYTNLAFNTTLKMFGVRSFRAEDYNSPTNWKREPTNRTLDIIDYGAGNDRDFTSINYKNNPWYSKYLPDVPGLDGDDALTKFSYTVGIKYSNKRGEFVTDTFEATTFQGPPSPGQAEVNPRQLPVVFTEPYFDCGRSNKWIVSAVSPVVDKLPRYLEWQHLRRNKYSAVVTMDIDFKNIDINPCPISMGNEAPNYFAGTARCKNTTLCEPLPGWGFQRGGYQCMCKPGYRYPQWQNGPFMGIDIESATEYEYHSSFDCLSVQNQLVIPYIPGVNVTKNIILNTENPAVNIKVQNSAQEEKAPQQQETNEKQFEQPDKIEEEIDDVDFLLRARGESGQPTRKKRSVDEKRQESTNENIDVTDSSKKKRKKVKLQPRYKRKHPRKKRNAFDPDKMGNYDKVMEHMARVTKDNCHLLDPGELIMPGSVTYGIEKQMSNQARTALKLANFISDFLQNIDKAEEYGTLRGDSLLNVDQLFAEVLSNVMADLQIKGSGIFFDRNAFVDENGERELFGPYAYRYYEMENEDGDDTGDGTGIPNDRVTNTFRALDYAGYHESYLEESWFVHVKERWASNTYGLTTYGQRARVRTDLNGTSVKKFQFFPIRFSVPKESDGYWTEPYFDCDGYVNEWIVTYAVPFFGRNGIRSRLSFKGVVIVDVRLDDLDINQCPMEYYVANGFKDTAVCHFESTFCVDLPARRFNKGSYKCECRQGYEYPYNDRAYFFDGQSMEKEYRALQAGEQNRYNTLKCRRAAHAASLSHPLGVLLLSVVLNIVIHRRS